MLVRTDIATAHLIIIAWLSLVFPANSEAAENSFKEAYNSGGLHFDGVDDIAIAESAPELSLTGSFTIEFWMKVDTLRDIAAILGKHQTGKNDDGSYLLTLSPGDPWANSRQESLNRYTINFSYPYKPNQTVLYKPSDMSIKTAEWCHLAVTYNKETGELSLFVNGGYVRTVNVELNLQETPWDFHIGAEGDNIHFHGTLGHLHLSDIQRYSSDFTPPKSIIVDNHTIAYYPMTEGYGNSLRDASENGRDGRILGASWAEPKTNPSIYYYIPLFVLVVTLLFITFRKRFGKSAHHTPRELEIQLFNGFEVRVKGKPISRTEWNNKQVQLLFILLVLHRCKTNNGVTSENLSLAFWPDASPDQVRTRRTSLVYKLRQALVDLGDNFIVHEDNAYCINFRDIDYSCDVEDFYRLSIMKNDRGDSIDKQLSSSYESALELYGEFGLVDEYDSDWFIDFKIEVHQKAIRISRILTGYYVVNNVPEQLKSLSNQMLHWDEFDEVAIKHLVLAEVLHGNIVSAKRIYRQHNERYIDDVGESFPISFDDICAARIDSQRKGNG